MRSRVGETSNYFVAFGDEFNDLVVKVWESPPDDMHILDEAIVPMPLKTDGATEVDVGAEDFLGNILIPCVPHDFVELPD